MGPTSHKAYQLFHDGVVALSQIEANGMKVDVEGLEKCIQKTEQEQKTLRVELQSTKTWSLWKRRYGERAKLGSNEQLGEILFKVMGNKCHETTATGKPSTDEDALEKIDLPFVKQWLKLKKYEKVLGTYLRGIQRELDPHGFIHCNYNLHIARTYRSSCDNPNLQNIPVRIPWISKLVRSNFVSRFGNDGVLVENDYKGVEVSVSACCHKDPKFIEYIINPKMDMHRDMGGELFTVNMKDLAKPDYKNVRYGAKNMFVFPQFYGDYYVRNAESLWEWMERAKINGPDGKPMAAHLRANGIKTRGKCDPEHKPVKGTFEYHVKEVEEGFWNKFPRYKKWKEEWYNRYLKEGGFTTVTGFRIDADMERNQVINYPVQGPAFHCLLWSLIRINRLLRKYKMKSKIISQVHDSVIGDVHRTELSAYLDIVHQVSTVEIRKDFTWLIVPLVVENEICPIGASWYDKREVVYKDGLYAFDNGTETLKTKSQDEFLDYILKKKAA